MTKHFFKSRARSDWQNSSKALHIKDSRNFVGLRVASDKNTYRRVPAMTMPQPTAIVATPTKSNAVGTERSTIQSQASAVQV